eukprot:1438469-Pyramimonas_sp.AAC.1
MPGISSDKYESPGTTTRRWFREKMDDKLHRRSLTRSGGPEDRLKDVDADNKIDEFASKVREICPR